MSLQSIRLTNFRSFLDTGRIELRPLVILVGANNTGKSSLLRFFPLLRQTMAARTRSPLLWFGEDVDFGDFDQALCHAATEREIRVEMDFGGWPGEEAKSNDSAGLQPVLTTRSMIAEHQGTIYVSRLDIQTSKGKGTLSFSPGGILEEVEYDGTLLRLDSLDHDAKQFHDAAKIATEKGESLISPEMPTARAWNGLIPNSKKFYLWAGNIDPFIRMLPVYCEYGSFWLAELATAMSYIGPVRKTPERFYRIQQLAVDRIAPQGENLAMFLHALPEADREALTDWIELHFGFRAYVDIDGSHVVLMIEERGRRYNLVDTGYGFSQVLPVAVQCWAAARGRKMDARTPPPSLIAIEQPELHLHPWYQARLADMFAGLVNARNDLSTWGPRLLVETHSEALLERLGELVEQGKLRREDALVLLVERDPETGVSTVRQSEFDEKGVLVDWPIGFFAA